LVKRYLRIVNSTRGTTLGDRIRIADGVWSRFIGLLGTSNLSPGSGLLIHPSQGVHTLGMLYPIDVIFLDRSRRIVGMNPSLRPFRMTAMNWKAQAVLELPAGSIQTSQTELNDQLEYVPV